MKEKGLVPYLCLDFGVEVFKGSSVFNVVMIANGKESHTCFHLL